jgi:hypothetical protein
MNIAILVASQKIRFMKSFGTAAILVAVVASMSGRTEAAVRDSFEESPGVMELIKAREGFPHARGSIPESGGAGWLVDPARKAGWQIAVPTPEQTVEITVIKEGSLEYTDAKGKKFPSKGNRMEQGGHVLLIAHRFLDLDSGPLAELALQGDPTSKSIERKLAGIGAPGGVVWFSALVRVSGEEDRKTSLRLHNSEYHPTASGLQFGFDPKSGEFFAGQDWAVLRMLKSQGEFPCLTTEASPVDPSETVWLVARVEFGGDWGTNPGFAEIDITSSPDSEVPPPTGRLQVWLNPGLAGEPPTADAIVDQKIFEFRFDSIVLMLGSGDAVDEIRLGREFADVAK